MLDSTVIWMKEESGYMPEETGYMMEEYSYKPEEPSWHGLARLYTEEHSRHYILPATPRAVHALPLDQ